MVLLLLVTAQTPPPAHFYLTREMSLHEFKMRQTEFFNGLRQILTVWKGRR
jgi:hypothetical protein